MSELTSLMAECGWVSANLEGGNLFTLQLADRFLVSMPGTFSAGGTKRIDTAAGIGFPAFSKACEKIGGATFRFSSAHSFRFRESRFESFGSSWKELLESTTETLSEMAAKQSFRYGGTLTV